MSTPAMVNDGNTKMETNILTGHKWVKRAYKTCLSLIDAVKSKTF